MTLRGLAGLLIYATLVLAPALPLLAQGGARGIALACGWAGLAMLALEFVLITRIHMATGPWGQDALLRFHRRAGSVGALLVLAHALILVAAGVPAGMLVSFSAGWALPAGSVAVLLLALLVASTLARRRLRLAYQAWLLGHRWLAVAAIALGLAHTWALAGLANPAAQPGAFAAWAIDLALALAALLWYRALRPWSQRVAWTLIANTPERGRTRRLRLQAPGAGKHFAAGQFCWLRLGGPWAGEAHPISIASAASNVPATTLDFVVKDLGDWSGRVVPALEPGTPVWLDGPYGVFTPARHPGPGYVLIGGGVGVTPLVSMALSLCAQGDAPVLLIHAAHDAGALCLHDELAALMRRAPQFEWIRVLEAGPWAAGDAAGYVSRELLARRLPADFKQRQFFVCGPAPMMDSVEQSLTVLGVPRAQLHTERFDMA